MAEEKRSVVERSLGVFTDVRAGEGRTSLWMFAGAFLVLAAYYFIKPAREGFLAASGLDAISDVELKAYTSLGQSLLLLAVLPLYDRVSGALSRRLLITWVPLFFAAHLVGFWLLQPGLFPGGARWIGIVFYLWVGIFNVFIVAQFWAFAADLYSDARGRRLFPLIAVGATAGATAGAAGAGRLVEIARVDAYALLLVAAAILAGAVAAMRAADALGDVAGRSSKAADAPSLAGAMGGFPLVFRHRYLLAAAVLMLTLNWVNTSGENLLFGVVQRDLDARAVEMGLSGDGANAFLREETTAFYGTFYFRVNALALFLQAFVASRLLRYGGFGSLLLMLPVIALVSYSLMAVFPVLAVVRAAKTAENATDYSINNTAKQILWLPTAREMKYRAKAVVDTFFVRIGDCAAAATAFVGTNLLALSLRPLFAFNAALVLVWLALGIFIVREHRRLRGETARPARG